MKSPSNAWNLKLDSFCKESSALYKLQGPQICPWLIIKKVTLELIFCIMKTTELFSQTYLEFESQLCPSLAVYVIS